MADVLITGAAKGIGRATAQELLRRGHHVVATDRSADRLVGLGADRCLTLDVTNAASVRAGFAAAGRLDAVVSNVGAAVLAPVETVPLAEVERLWRVNVLGAWHVSQAALPRLRSSQGRLVFVSSMYGRTTRPLLGPYASTKWALEALAETIALEVVPFGVRVVLVEPGSVRTEGSLHAPSYVEAAGPYRDLDGLRQARTPDRLQPEEVACVLADAIEDPDPPLRIPVGEPARAAIAARHAAPGDRPFDPFLAGS